MIEVADMSPKFISFEGIDGCGKTTLLQSLAGWLHEADVPHLVTREPGGTLLGEKIRSLLLDVGNVGMTPEAEVLLYTASRVQLVEEVIRPALGSGKWVLSDRFADATLAYQGYGRDLGAEMLSALQTWATRGLMPDLTVLLDCDPVIAARRMGERTPDRIEAEGFYFQKKVREGYLTLASNCPRRFLVLNANREVEEVVAEFRASLGPALNS